jgi:hypothetical protein
MEGRMVVENTTDGLAKARSKFFFFFAFLFWYVDYVQPTRHAYPLVRDSFWQNGQRQIKNKKYIMCFGCHAA